MSTEKNRFDDALEDDMEEDDGAVRTAAASALPAHIAAAIDAAAAAVGSGVSMADYRAAEKVFDEALELFETASSDDGKRTKAYELFSRAAAARLPRGVCFLAQCTYEGVGVEANLQEAVRLWQEASKLGDMSARYKLAEMKLHGDEIEQNEVEAFEIFKELAEKGDVWSQYQLACMYNEGKGTNKNEGKGLEWMQRAAESGHEFAEQELALLLDDAPQGEGQDDIPLPAGAENIDWAD